MHWQDIVLTLGSIVFIIALLPSVLSKNKPAVSTSLSTGIVLAIFAGVYVSLALWFTATTTGVTSAVWLVLAFQKYRESNIT